MPIGLGPEAASISVRNAELTGSFTAAELFGASAHRTLQFTLANDGGDAKTLTALIKVGGTPQPLVTLQGLSQGQSRTYSIRVDFPRGSIGTQEVTGQISAGGNNYTNFKTTTMIMPWGLVLIGAIIVALILLWIALGIRKRIIERRERKQPPIARDGPLDSLGQGGGAGEGQSSPSPPERVTGAG